MRNTKKEIISTILILLINIVVLAVVLGLHYIFENLSKINYFEISIIIYISLVIIFNILSFKFDNKFLKVITSTLSFPISLIVSLMAIVIPVLTTQSYLVVYLLISFLLPLISYRIDEKFGITNLTNENWVFLFITVGVIIATTFNKQIEFLTFKLLPFTSRKKDKSKRREIVELCKYIVSANNIKLVIYTLYFLALFIFNYLNFQNSSFFGSQNIDKAILQSFITFLAFERMLSNFKLSEFSSSKLLITMQSSVNNEIDELTGKK